MFNFFKKTPSKTKESFAPLPAIFIGPGDGYFVAKNQKVYSLDLSHNILEDGIMVLNGSGIKQIAYYNELVYAQDLNSGYWYNWNGKHWSSIVTQPPVS